MWNTVTTQKWRLLGLRIHRWSGLVAGIPLLVLAMTGCVMAFESQIDKFFHPSLFKVLPHGDALPLSAVIDQVAVGLRPQEHIQVCVVPPKPTNSYSFTIFGTSGLPRQTFANQYDGHVLGTLSVVRFVLIMHTLHEASGILMGCSAIVLALSVASGLYLWWPLKRIGVIGRGPKRIVYFELHNSVGFFSSLFLLSFALTGTYMAFDAWTVPATYKLTGTRPLQGNPVSKPQGGKPVSPEHALEVARESLPQAIPLWIVLPQEPESSYLVKMRFPEDHSSNGTSIVWVDQYSGRVLTVWDSRNASLARKIENMNRAVHTGELLGYPGKTLACLMSFALAVQILTGFSLWRKTRSKETANA
jgi:uncharacterized iron-regulated membrane protein